MSFYDVLNKQKHTVSPHLIPPVRSPSIHWTQVVAFRNAQVDIRQDTQFKKHDSLP